MLGSYQVESYRVRQSTHGVTLLLNLPVNVMNFTVVFKEANWLPMSTRQFKGQARSVTADSAASRDCVVRFALAIRAQT